MAAQNSDLTGDYFVVAKRYGRAPENRQKLMLISLGNLALPTGLEPVFSP